VVASVQTLHEERLKRWPLIFAQIIIDEAHHATALMWRRVFEHFRCALVGITATARRAGLANLFSIVFRMGLKEAIDEGWLVPLLFDVPTIPQWDLKKLKRPRKHLWECGNGHQAELVEREKMVCGECSADLRMVSTKFSDADFAAILEEEGTDRIVPAIKEGIQRHIEGRKALVFTPSVTIAKVIADWMRTNTTIASEAVSNKTPRTHGPPRCMTCNKTMEMVPIRNLIGDLFGRSWGFDSGELAAILQGGQQDILTCDDCQVMEQDLLARCRCRRCLVRRFKSWDLRLLANYGIFIEGFDDESVNLIVLMRKVMDLDLYEQMIGRGARLHPSIKHTISDCATAADRRALIAGSPKPNCLIVDLKPAQLGFRVATPAGLLVGHLPDLPDKDLDALTEGGDPVSLNDMIGLAHDRAAQIAEEMRREEEEKERRDREHAAREEKKRKRREKMLAQKTKSVTVRVDYLGGGAPTFPPEQDRRPDVVKKRHDSRFATGSEELASRSLRNDLFLLHRRMFPHNSEESFRYARNMDALTALWSKEQALEEISYLKDSFRERRIPLPDAADKRYADYAAKDGEDQLTEKQHEAIFRQHVALHGEEYATQMHPIVATWSKKAAQKAQFSLLKRLGKIRGNR